MTIGVDEYYRLKTHAFFHDPPDKAFCLSMKVNHAERGRILAEALAGKAETGWDDIVKKADILAAALDRATILKDLQVDFCKDPLIRHPLGGPEIRISEWRGGYLPVMELHDICKTLLDSLPTGAGSTRARFIWAINDLFRSLSAADENVGILYHYLPADTRMPNHTILAHMSLTSAFAGVLARGEKPALLSFMFGPVQGFITNARKVRDLWAGSDILATLAFRAAEVVMDEYGPDHIIFPVPMGQPLFKKYLEEMEIAANGQDEELQRNHASLPNRYLAIVGWEKAGEIGVESSKALSRAFAETIEKSIQDSGILIPGWNPDLVRRQACEFLESCWVAVPMGNSPDEARKVIEEVEGAPPPKLPDGYGPKSTSYYGTLYDACERLMTFRKQTRIFSRGGENEALKCSVCGERSVCMNAPPDGPIRLFRDGELLCGVCLAKRLHGFGSRGEGTQQPSTSDVAVWPFIWEVGRKLLEHDDWKQLAQIILFRLTDDVTAKLEIKRDGAWHAAPLHNLPGKLDEKHREDAAMAIRHLLDIGGTALLGTTGKKEDMGEEDLSHVWEALDRVRILLEELGENGLVERRPSPYLAAIQMDGDDMGKWLGGDPRFPGTPTWNDTISSKCSGEPQSWMELSGKPRPVSASIHRAVSEIARDFALHLAPDVLQYCPVPSRPLEDIGDNEEERYFGHLVYSGGDDMLALAPAGWAPEIARLSRLKFAGEGFLDKGGEKIRYEFGSGKGWSDYSGKGALWQPCLAMGVRATMSAGISVFHHSHPLGLGLEAAREALEEHAKKLNMDRYLMADPPEGRRKADEKDGLCLVIMKRSGERIVLSVPWFIAVGTDRNSTRPEFLDTVRILTGIQWLFSREILSPGVVPDLARLLASFDESVWGICRMNLADARRIVGPGNMAFAGRAGKCGAPAALVVHSVQRHVDDDAWRKRVETALLDAILVSPSSASFVDFLRAAVFLARPER